MKGIDVSSNQHPANKPIDWFAVADAGYGFAIVKALAAVTVDPAAVRARKLAERKRETTYARGQEGKH